MNRSLIISAFFIIQLSCFAQSVIISGTNRTYSNQEIVVFSDVDFITEIPVELGKSVVDSVGCFQIEIDVKQTLLAYLTLGVYKCQIYIEPGVKYSVILPNFMPKTFEEKLNPYFEFPEAYLGIVNEESKLNFHIRKFDEIFDGYINDFGYQLIQKSFKSNVDTFIVKLDSLFIDYSHPFFNDYKFYKYAHLRNVAYERNTKFVTKEYFLFKPFLYKNPAYTIFFNQLYANYFDYYGRTKEGEKIFYDISYAKSIHLAKQTLDNNISLANDTLKELVLVKGLHDALLNPDWPTDPLLQTLDSIIILTRISEHREIAKNIKHKMTKLRRGFPAPDFEVYSKDSILKSLADYNGKYLYLNFCTSWSFDCNKQFESLKEFLDEYPKHLNIVTISADENFSSIIKKFEEEDYSWDLLHFSNNEEIIEDYNVKVFPSYFLIDPYGKLIMNPAPTPEENFETYFINILRSKIRRNN